MVFLLIRFVIFRFIVRDFVFNEASMATSSKEKEETVADFAKKQVFTCKVFFPSLAEPSLIICKRGLIVIIVPMVKSPVQRSFFLLGPR
jgi:hypothetical protein